MTEPAGEPMVRVVAGPGALSRLGQEAGALGTRALVLSPTQSEPRESALAGRVGAALRSARIGHHPFPRVPRPGAALRACSSSAAEAARESRCRFIIGVGDAEALDAARAASAAALLPCLLVPTSVGYGRVGPGAGLPLPDVVVLDPEASVGSPPRRTAALGLRMFGGLLERYAARVPDERGSRDGVAEMEDAMRGLLDRLAAAVAQPDDPGPRADLAVASGRAVEGFAAAGPGSQPVEPLVARLVSRGVDEDRAWAALLPALMDRSGDAGTVLSRPAVAAFGRLVLGIRETDDGRAAAWAAGGVRQWVRNLGFASLLPADADLPTEVRDALRDNRRSQTVQEET